jgi:hypothetical protein
MAVGIRIKLPGIDQETFDKVNDHVDLADPPNGLIFHSSGPIDGGWGIIDFWESRDAFDAFFGSRVKAAVDATGAQMSGAPDVKEFPVHELYKS